MRASYLFTSESVSEGHPDKVCDQISDAILDAFIENDVKLGIADDSLVNTRLGCEIAVDVHEDGTRDVALAPELRPGTRLAEPVAAVHHYQSGIAEPLAEPGGRDQRLAHAASTFRHMPGSR